MAQTIITNANLILEDRILAGTIAFDTSGIQDLGEGRSNAPHAIDAEGDFIAPGLIEMHTDNAERHFEPRPGVVWPDDLGAILTHDSQIVSAGITTVYDAVCAGYATKRRQEIFPRTLRAIHEAHRMGLFRADHRIHIRCELTGEDLIDAVKPFVKDPLIQLMSLMDHTPGQRQWRDLEAMRRYHVASGHETSAQHEKNVAKRLEIGPLNRTKNLPLILELARGMNVPLASHDDTTARDVEEAARYGAVISEFPTTMEAAQMARAKGLATVAGAPNVVRGCSHSSGVAAKDLIEAGLLDGLSSDYVPASLLQAVVRLSHAQDDKLISALAMCTSKMADILKLHDRGRMRRGLRADLIRFRCIDVTPVVRDVWVAGKRVH